MNDFFKKYCVLFLSFWSFLGFTGGSWYHHSGAAVEPLCLPKDPQWGAYKNGVDKWRAYVFGAEYETNTFTGSTASLHDHDVPCAVCLTRGRSVVKMFPGKVTMMKREYIYRGVKDGHMINYTLWYCTTLKQENSVKCLEHGFYLNPCFVDFAAHQHHVHLFNNHYIK